MKPEAPKAEAANLTEVGQIASADLAYAASCLIAQGKTKLGELRRLGAKRQERIDQLEAELAAVQLHGIPPDGVPSVRRSTRVAVRAASRGAAPKKRKFTMTPKAKAARRVQGKYLGMLRSLAGRQRAAVKRIAASEGIPAAIAAAKKLVSRPS